MTTVSATEARKRLYALIDEVGQSHEPVQITGKRGNAVLLSEDDWRAIQETLHLVSIPAMRESILEGMAKKGAPSRAEVSDAAMSILAECAMLNKGPNILETVRMLDGIIGRMDKHFVKHRPTLRKLSVARIGDD